MAYPVPTDEPHRIVVLHDYNLLDTDSEEPFDLVAELVRQAMDTEVAAINLVDADRVWSKAICCGSGAELARQLPRSHAYCAHAILGDATLIIEDARQDARFCHHPATSVDPPVLAYAGAPILGYGGARIGVLCVFDTRPRRFSVSQRRLLRQVAAGLSDILEVRRLRRASADPEHIGRLSWLDAEATLAILDLFADTPAEAGPDRALPASFEAAVAELSGTCDMVFQMMLNVRGRRPGDRHVARFAASGLLEHLQTRFGPRIDTQRRQLVLADRSGAAKIAADRAELRQALFELVDNAISYSPLGAPVRVEVEAEPDAVVVLVRDRGAGPPRDQLDVLSQSQVSAASLIDYGRPGPRRGDGLALCRAAVEAAGGTLDYRLDEPTGCTFIIRLPRAD